MRRSIFAALSVALAIGAVACSDTTPSGPTDTNPAAPPAAPPAPPAPPIPPGQLLYVDDGITLINSDGSGVVKLAYGWSPDWSPDGSRFVFSNTRCETDWETYYTCVSGGLLTMNPETRETTIVPNGEFGAEPAWSPTGEMIAFGRRELGQLVIMRLDGSQRRELSFPYIHFILEPSWSPDGRRLVFGCLNGYSMGVCVVNSDGTGFLRLTSNDDYAVSPAWSPDGSRIAFQFSNFQRGIGEIALMTPDGNAVTRITEGHSPAWSRDGTKLIFSGVQGGLYISNVDGSNVTRLTTRGHSPAWRP